MFGTAKERTTMSEPKDPQAILREVLGETASMPTADVLAALTYCEIGKRPELPLALALARRTEVQDRLLAEISQSQVALDARYEAPPDERHAYLLHTFAVYLLALWEEPRAFQPLVSYLAEDTHTALDQLQDTVTEDLHTILARIYDGSDVGALQRIIEDDDAESYVRSACLRSLHVMVRLGKLPRADVVAFYAHALEKLRGDQNGDWSDLIVIAAAEMQEPALRPAIDRWFADGLVDDMSVRPEDIDRIYRELPEVLDEQLLQVGRFENLSDYLCDWAWFNTEDLAEFEDPYDDHDFEDDGGPRRERSGLQPVVREGPKIGRNEPCPCGSGKKYKKCCLV